MPVSEFLHIPNRDTAGLFGRYYVALSLVFSVVYGGMNYLTSIRGDLYPLYFDWESQIPFVPEFIYAYLSIFLVFLLPLFSLSKPQIRALAVAFTVATISAGVVYLILPARLATVRPDVVPGHEFVFKWLYTLALPHNLFPSLHITYATLFMGVVSHEERHRVVRGGLVLWWGLLIASVLLVRQHQVVDIAGGIALAFLCFRFVYRRLKT